MNNNYFYPEDIEHRNVIDRLANFVAKNGDEFELMTKQKQQGNSMFEFLFGGAYSDYYQYRLSEERRKMDNENHTNHNSEFLENKSYTPSSNQYSHGFDFTQTDYFQNYNVIEEMDKRLCSLKMSLADLQSVHYGKLNESQQNLNSESICINQEKMKRCLTTVNINRLNKIKESCKDYNINFETMENIIQSLITSCTKDNICNGKNFVIENMIKDNKTTQFICEYLLANVSKSSLFNDRLHIIYFLNDLLHYCKRKSVPILLNAIESVIVLIYSMSVLLADEDGKSKLNKVLSLWESNCYIKTEILNSMKIINDNPKPHVDEWLDREIMIIKREEDEMTIVNNLIPVEESISRILSDAKMKLSNLEANHNQLKYELKIEEENIQLEIYQLEREIKMAEVEVRKTPRESSQREYQDYQETDYGLQMMQNYDMSFQMPDITRPPPGFAICDMPCMTPEPQLLPPIIQQTEIEKRPERPSIPYWRLPAAVMVAHVKLAQFDYEPIDANAIQLPQLKPPSKRLIDITNTFYQPPSHERPRDTEGWEKSALHEFYKAKEMAKTGEQPNDFISSLHEKHNEDDYHESIQVNERLMDTDYRHMDISDLNDFRSVTDLNCSNPDYSFHHQAPQYGISPNCSPRVSNQRSLLRSPWEEYRHHPFNNPDMPLMRNMSYNNSSNRAVHSLLGDPPRHMPPKVTPLMSLDVSNNFKRQSNPRNKRDSYSRNMDNMPYNNRNKNRRRYLSRSRSPYNRSESRSRSRSRSSRYSHSRSRTYSRSRSFSRSRSQSSRSSRSSDKLPYKGGFIARKSRSRSYSRSRSLSRSPRSEYETPHNQYNKIRNDNFEEATEPVLRSEHYPEDDRYTNEDVFSRFRLRKSVGYSEWMKERTERRIGVPEELPESY